MEIKLGKRLRQLRNQRGATQEELASQIGVTYQAVSKWENDTTMPDTALLPQIAMALGVTIDALFSVDRSDELRRVDLILQQGAVSDEQFGYVSRLLNAILRENPEDTDAKKRYLRLYLLRRHSDRLAAENLLAQLLTLCCEDDELYLYCRDLYGGGGEVRHADNRQFVERCRDFVMAHPEAVRVREYLIEALIDLRRYDEAQALTDGLPTEDAYAAYLPEIWFGDLLLARGNTDAAVSVWRTVPIENHKGQYEVGVRLERLGDTDGAKTCYEASFSAAEYPRDLSAVYALAFLREKQGDIRGAIDAWETVLAVLSSDWNKTGGEDVDWPRIEICRLRAVL
ncbi:MAG: helix-turn-helix domain-containing protein [Ruminococcaceae bacterium]|nr:helix-turn-helix domain-containing protein [Oscillospiraceae bacterium]